MNDENENQEENECDLVVADFIFSAGKLDKMYNCMFSRLINSEIIADPLKPIIIKLITVCAQSFQKNWKRSIKSMNNFIFVYLNGNRPYWFGGFRRRLNSDYVNSFAHIYPALIILSTAAEYWNWDLSKSMRKKNHILSFDSWSNWNRCAIYISRRSSGPLLKTGAGNRSISILTESLLNASCITGVCACIFFCWNVAWL